MGTTSTSGDTLIGRVFKDTYRVTEFIGEGGMGRVYKGEHLRLKKPIVIKVLGEHLTRSSDSTSRFRREAILQAMVNHPCAVQTLDLDEEPDGTVYIVLEFAPGDSLQKILDHSPGNRLSPDRAFPIARQLLEILAVSHDVKIVHRDLKPDNIMIETRGGRDLVRVLDFGIAALLDSSEVGHTRKIVGTPYYMAPEQAAAEGVDGRSDLYSVGVILFQMLTGRLPLHHARLDEFFVKLANEYPPKVSEAAPGLEIPKPIEDLIDTTLSKDPYNRPQSAEEMLTVLGAMESRRTRNFLLVALASLVVGAVAIAWFYHRSDPLQPYRLAAESARQQAWAENPRFAQADEMLADARQLHDQGSLTQAEELYEASRRLFEACVPYQPHDESRATAARGEAHARRPEHSLTLRGDTYLTKAERAQSLGDFETAYEAYRAAAVYYSYDEGPETEARKAMATANPEHPAFDEARATLLQAEAVFRQRELTEQDLNLAHRLFQQAAQGFREARPYDPSHETAAHEAMAACNKENPQFQSWAARLGDAIAAKRRGDYEEAYRLFDQAEAGLRAIPARYDPGPQREAETARAGADPTHASFQRATEAFDAGVTAHSRGEYGLAYVKFREARDLFRSATAYDPSPELEANAARERASPAHPNHALGLARLEEGQRHKRAYEFATALESFREATRLFRAAPRYDPEPEESAARARREANLAVPVTGAAAEQAFQQGKAAHQTFDYEKAYRAFRRAADLYRSARFDGAVRLELERARAAADPNHPSYARATALEREGEQAWQEGDGPRAETKLRQATSLFAFARRIATGPAPTVQNPPPPPPPDTGDEDREVRRKARRARDAALELKNTCDEWARSGTINRATAAFYDEGLAEWEEGERAYKGEDFSTAERHFRVVLDRLSKVSNKSR